MAQLDRCKLIETLLRIDNKQGLVVPFRANRIQRYFQQHKSNRNIVLKHRQGGVSSYILGDMFIDDITIPNTQCAVVSHETRATQRLLDRVQFFYDTMDEPKPQIGAESRSEKTFQSYILVSMLVQRGLEPLVVVILSEKLCYQSLVSMKTQRQS